MSKLGNKLLASVESERNQKNSVANRFSRLDNESTVSKRFDNLESVPKEGEKSIEHVLLPIDQVEDNPFNARYIYVDSVIQARAASIAANGQTTAAYVARRPNGVLQIIDGQYRKRALLLLGRKEILARIVDVTTDEDMYRLSYISNDHRDAQTPMDNAMAWQHLLDTGICKTEDDIAKITLVSKSWVSRTLAIMSLPKSSMDKIAEHPDAVNQSVAYELVLYYRSINDDIAVNVLIDRVIHEGLGKRELESLRKKSAEKPVRTHQMSRQYKIKELSGVTGNLKEWDSGRLLLDIKVEDAAMKEKLMAVLQEHLKLK